MSDSVRPHRWQPTRLCRPWDSSGKNTGVGCHFLQCMKVKSESEVAQSCPTLQRPHGLQPTRLLHPWGFPGKNTGVGCHCLLWEDPLEEGKAAHSSIHAWRIPMGWGAWRATVHGVTKSQTQLKWLNRHPHRHYSQRTGNNICVCICWIICWVNHNCMITPCFYLGIKHTICSQISSLSFNSFSFQFTGGFLKNVISLSDFNLSHSYCKLILIGD